MPILDPNPHVTSVPWPFFKHLSTYYACRQTCITPGASLVDCWYKESSCKVGDLGSIPGLGRSLGEGNGYSLQYSGLENSMDCISMGSQRVGHDWATFWRRQWHPTPVLLPGKSHGRRSLVGCSPWGRSELDRTERLHFHFSLSCIGEGDGKPTPVFLPGESQGWRSLVGCRLWGRTESDTTEATQQQQSYFHMHACRQTPCNFLYT